MIMYRYFILITITEKFFYWTDTSPDSKEQIVKEINEYFDLEITTDNIKEEGEVNLPVENGIIRPSIMNLETKDEIRSTATFGPESMNTPASEDDIPILPEDGGQDEIDQVSIQGGQEPDM